MEENEKNVEKGNKKGIIIKEEEEKMLGAYKL